MTSHHGGWLTWQARQVEFVLQGPASGVVSADLAYPRREFGGLVGALGITAQLFGQLGGGPVRGALGALDGMQDLLLKDGDGVGRVLSRAGAGHLKPAPTGASAMLGSVPSGVSVALPQQRLDEDGVARRLRPERPGAGRTDGGLGTQQLLRRRECGHGRTRVADPR